MGFCGDSLRQSRLPWYPFRLLTAFAATLPLLSLRDIFPRPGEVGPQSGSPWQSTQSSSLCQGLSLWERWICEAKTERARMLSVVLLQKRNTGTPAGVPVPRSLNKEDQIRLRASSSPTRMKSGCSCRMLAGTSGVTGPKKAFLTISALPLPFATMSTLRACMIVLMPMV